MDLQEKTRMQDTYKAINQIIYDIGNLGTFPPLVWVWTWDVVHSTLRDFIEDEEYNVHMALPEIWELFYTQADQNGFTLEYGTEDLYESIRDWMIDQKIVTYIEEDLCESCESNPKENPEGKYCTSCRDEFKESE